MRAPCEKVGLGPSVVVQVSGLVLEDGKEGARYSEWLLVGVSDELLLVNL